MTYHICHTLFQYHFQISFSVIESAVSEEAMYMAINTVNINDVHAADGRRETRQ